MLKFRRMSEADREILKNRCRDILHGTESFTYLSCIYDTEEFFWCGVDERDEIKTLIMNTGDGNFPVFGEEIPSFLTIDKRCTMVYGGTEIVADDEVTELENRRIGEFYELYSSSHYMGFDDKIRYVNTLHCKNKGFCKFFGIIRNDNLVSVSAVTAINDRFALIGNVFTIQSRRNEGLAEKCVKKCIEFSLSQGKIPFLYCEENMREYYKKSGFEEIYE